MCECTRSSMSVHTDRIVKHRRGLYAIGVDQAVHINRRPAGRVFQLMRSERVLFETVCISILTQVILISRHSCLFPYVISLFMK